MTSTFSFQQALFGYDNGHHLLRASLPLPTDMRHTLAVATDLSGSSPAEGFEASYTGIPLAGSNYYALFCTWLAPEAPRPGCVWSHVVFIELADFAELKDLTALRRLFRRPDKDNWNDYEKPIKFTQSDNPSKDLPANSLAYGRSLLLALYSAPKRSIVFLTNDWRDAEELTFMVWSQQWPRLRRSFRFSTGSFADRGRGGIPFDLQISPVANRRAWQRHGEHLIVDKDLPEAQAEVSKVPAWLALAFGDLASPGTSAFRAFIREYGSDIEQPRAAFRNLAEAYFRARDIGSWLDLLNFVGSTFPAETEALTLKQQLVDPEGLLCDGDTVERCLATATFLLTSDQAHPFSKTKADLGKIAPILWRTKRAEVLSLISEIIRQHERPLGTEFVEAVSKIVEPVELIDIAQQGPELVPLLIGHRPSLATRVLTWQLPQHIQQRIYELLTTLRLAANDWGDIMAAMFVAATSIAVRDAVDRAGVHAIDGAFKWLDNEIAEQVLPSQLWRDALATPALDRLQRGGWPSPNAFALCSWFPPADKVRQAIRGVDDDVRLLATQPLSGFPGPLRLHVAFLSVTLGLRVGGVNGATLLASGFFEVHAALASQTYSIDAWLLLSPELPNLGFWRDWDRCERLRRAVRNCFSAQGAAVTKALLDRARDAGERALVDQIGIGKRFKNHLDPDLL